MVYLPYRLLQLRSPYPCIALFLQKLHYTFQSCKLCSPFWFFRAASSPKKRLKGSTDTAWFETGRRQWRHTQVRAAFAHTLDLLFGFQSWLLRLSQGVCHHFSSEAQQGIPSNSSFAIGKKVPFFPRFFSGKISNNRVKQCVSEPKLEKLKKNPNQAKKKKLFCPPIFPVSLNSPWLMASTLENTRFFQIRRPYVPTTVPFQGKS